MINDLYKKVLAETRGRQHDRTKPKKETYKNENIKRRNREEKRGQVRSREGKRNGERSTTTHGEKK